MKKATAQKVAALPEHARVQVETLQDLMDKSEDVIALYKGGARVVLHNSYRDVDLDVPLTLYPLLNNPEELGRWTGADRARLSKAYGYHSNLCWDMDSEQGQAIGDHGPWCESQIRGHVRGWNDDGQVVEISASVVDRYRQGVYVDYQKRIGKDDRFIAVRTGDQPGELITYLSVGEALRLAAGINALAAAADSIDGPLPGSKKAKPSG